MIDIKAESPKKAELKGDDWSRFAAPAELDSDGLPELEDALAELVSSVLEDTAALDILDTISLFSKTPTS